MRLVVTGCAGFIGSHLCERLLSDGHTVTGVDSFTDYYDRDRKDHNISGAREWSTFRLVEADLVELDLEPLLASSDGVFHLAGQPGVRASWGAAFDTYLSRNVLATQRLFEAVRAEPTPVVLASSSSVYGLISGRPTGEDSPRTPVSPYGLTKLAAEHLARIYSHQYDVPVVCLRYFTVFGPRQRPDMAFSRFFQALSLGQPIQLLGDGRQSRDFTYVADIVDATVRALHAPRGSVYNVGGGAPVALQTAIDCIAELYGRRPPVMREDVAAGDVTHTWADATRARTELGWKPQVSLRDGLAEQLAWARATLTPASP